MEKRAKDSSVRSEKDASAQTTESLFADLKKAAQRGREDRGSAGPSK
jgi:hypothetical protein